MKSRRPWHSAILIASLILAGLACADSGTGPESSQAYARGARIYERCAACHALDADRTGPRHCGLLGRRAGSVPGFSYSPAMRRSKLIWTEENLDRFLKSPVTAMPGTAMGYDGIKDDQERHDLIHYLREAGREPRCQAFLANSAKQSK